VNARIRQVHRNIARRATNLDPYLLQVDNLRPTQLFDYAMSKVNEAGVKLVHKTPLNPKSRLASFTTTYFREIRLGVNYNDRPTASKASLLMHELVHVRQWREYGPVNFATNYVLVPGFRWAVEVQAYRESIRAQRTMRTSTHDATMYAHEVAFSLYNNYMLSYFNKSHLIQQTHNILKPAVHDK